MKICILTVEYSPIESGVAVACRRIVNSLKKKNEVHVLTFSSIKDGYLVNQKRVIESEIKDGVHIHKITPYSGTLTNVPAQEIQNMCYFLEKLDKKFDFDIFHGFNLTGVGYVAVFMAKMLKKRSIVSIRGNDVGRDIFDLNKLYGINWIIENANQLTFVAPDLLEQANNLIQCKKKSTVILNSLDPFEFYFKDIKLKLDGLVVCFSGVVRRKKGFSYLLEAFNKFTKKYKGTLLIVGELMKEEKVSYLKMIEDLNLEGYVMITGRMPHNIVLNYVNLCDVFVMPAVSEGCSNSLLEAMYCKKPCIATNVGAAPKLIKDGKNGLLIEPHSVDGIYKALMKLKRSKKLRDLIGKEAKKTILTKFTPKNELKEWTRVYKKCLK